MMTIKNVFAFVVLVASVACTEATGADAPDAVVGVWTLQTWNGQSLPAITYGSSAGYNEAIVSERFVVSTDGSFSMERTYRYMPEGKTEVQSGSGSWKRKGTGYVIGDGFVPGRMSDGALIIDWKADGKTDWVYSRSQ
jgi:hypothetical protein